MKAQVVKFSKYVVVCAVLAAVSYWALLASPASTTTLSGRAIGSRQSPEDRGEAKGSRRLSFPQTPVRPQDSHNPERSEDETSEDSFKDLGTGNGDPPARNGRRGSNDSLASRGEKAGEHRRSSQVEVLPPAQPRAPNFFNTMTCSFVTLKLGPDNQIPSDHFLQCCQATAGVFDKLSSTTFSPVKSDFTGNIKKITQKYNTNPTALTSLQKIVLLELERKQHLDPNSATQALLWLKRGLDFIKELLFHLAQGKETKEAGYTAYENTLKPHHNFVVKGVFSLAMQAAPYRKHFLQKLANDTPPALTVAEYEEAMMEDIRNYTQGIGRVTSIISNFYVSHQLHT